MYTYLFTTLVFGAVGIRYYQIQYFSDIFFGFWYQLDQPFDDEAPFQVLMHLQHVLLLK